MNTTPEQVLAAARERWPNTNGLLEFDDLWFDGDTYDGGDVTLWVWEKDDLLPPVFTATAPDLPALLEKVKGETDGH